MPRHKILLERNNDKERLIVYEILSGKPNNQLLPSEQTIANRIERPAQKGETCFQYAAHMLRVRCGKHPDIQETEERIIEKKISQARHWYSEFYVVKKTLEALSCRELDIDNRTDAQLMFYLFFVMISKNISSYEKALYSHAINKVINSRRLGVTLEFEKMKNEVLLGTELACRERILKMYDIDPSQAFDENIGAYMNHLPEIIRSRFIHGYRALPTELKLCFSNHLQSAFEMNALKFIPISWQYPGDMQNETEISESFDALQQVLRENGPILIGGFYGKSYPMLRSVDSVQELEIGETGLTAQFYPESEHRLSFIPPLHVVVMVGIHEKENEKWVYFMDPNDASKPGDAPKIYAMHFKTMCQYSTRLNIFTWFRTDKKMGAVFAAPPEPDNLKLKPRYIGF